MMCNVGRIDSIVRIVAGVALLIAGMGFHSWWGLIGLLPLGTGLIHFCPVYYGLKFSTCGPPGATSPLGHSGAGE